MSCLCLEDQSSRRILSNVKACVTFDFHLLQVDPSIIGGMVVNIGDKYVDMSMTTKLNAYTNLIKQAI